MTLNLKIFSLLKCLLLIFKSWDSKLRFILSRYSVGKKGCHIHDAPPPPECVHEYSPSTHYPLCLQTGDTCLGIVGQMVHDAQSSVGVM